MSHKHYQALLTCIADGQKCLAVLVDPDKFHPEQASAFLNSLPETVTHIFVGGSSVTNGHTEATAQALKQYSDLPLFLFPGDHSQITPTADALLFLSLLSGRNAEYLVGQQVKSIARLKASNLEIISTGYILLDGGTQSAVARVTDTVPLPQKNIETIVHTALAGAYMGAKLIYLEAGSGAKIPVSPDIITAVKAALDIPLLVGGGIRTEAQKQEAYRAGADLVVMGTAFETN
ncbi:geranylgeranylglyceryl/heptaprenylglyceryl phosphate synthase [Altibacter sp.]|uniref:geranylgeranylglyceryl/heptaprenylglyceryl phosphate synthase n=1 Tax=Altibacter sp. TaxID=2024823 RepID=UPI000C8C7E34|nr:geranylgeranylglyceryl/heptaprenylglyceryl phosphate synthase [Altibacter sp.]MAP53641.1 geranylgeranylglyceryl/heptaprenylglyceryl phosphate synthase [Altibacter sp.]|tara:strand:+ start:150 stop:848 length:699 start_codon:yes stop_codon:yes gene_type:complete